ncbi:hypothetical protein JOB18_037529 [Solea senegalensis]|uniref:Integrase zinc-binding domain-containing protein n=1 Tax=Solea senegalensis TaxID=28829 RepID=A0AAV6SGJ1_SOLSE|nr:hypothetical protein JOB18_037529 [Solea senegalensis]
MEELLGPHIHDCCIPYLDDMLDVEALHKVLQALQTHGVKLRPEKCELFRQEVSGRLPHKGGHKAPVSPLLAGGWVASLLCFLHFRVRVVTGPLGCCCWLRAVHRSVPLTACRWSLSGSVDPSVPRCVGRDRLIDHVLLLTHNETEQNIDDNLPTLTRSEEEEDGLNGSSVSVMTPDADPADGEAAFSAAVALTPKGESEEWADGEWETAQASNPNIQVVKGVIDPHSNEEHFQIVCPSSRCQEVWRKTHKAAAHAGVDRTLSWIRRRFYWPDQEGELEVSAEKMAVQRGGIERLQDRVQVDQRFLRRRSHFF